MHFDVGDAAVDKSKLNSCNLQRELDNYKSAELVPTQCYERINNSL